MMEEDCKADPTTAVSKIVQPRKRRRRLTESEVRENALLERISGDSLLRKLRDNSTWIQFAPQEIQTMESWLFDENLGYAKTAARVEKEFGIKVTIASVGRYYRRRAREREADELVEAQLAADGINGLGVDANSLRAAVVKLVGKAALNMANEKPEEVDRLASLTQVMLEAEQNDLRRGRLELAERYFDYEKTVESLNDMPQFRAYLQSINGNPRLSHKEKIKRVTAILFQWEKRLKQQKGSDGK